MKILFTILILLSVIPAIAQTSFTREEGNGSLSPDKKWYVQIISGPSKINKKTTIGIYLYNVENKKASKRLDKGYTVEINKDDVPTFKLVFPALSEERARGSEFKWDKNGFEVSFIGIGNKVFKYDILRGTFSLEFPKIKKDKTLNK